MEVSTLLGRRELKLQPQGTREEDGDFGEIGREKVEKGEEVAGNVGAEAEMGEEKAENVDEETDQVE